MPKKRNYLLIYGVFLIGVVALAYIGLRPQPMVYYAEVLAMEKTEERVELMLGPAVSPYPERDINLSEPRQATVETTGLELQIRRAPDGNELADVDLVAMFHELAPGDQIGVIFRDQAETVLKSILFTTPTK